LNPTPHNDYEVIDDTPPSVSIAHAVHVLKRYRHVIFVSLVAVALAYALFAVATLLMSPTERVTSLPFRLDFDGAGNGRYPNAARFNVTDIVSGPILLRVFQDNRLKQYVSFDEFSRSVFVLESNREYESLAADYAARIADPKLSPVDRERLQREFDLKRESIAKNAYQVSYTRPVWTRSVPDTLARKVLLDVLSDWADFAVNQLRVTTYQVSVLSPSIVDSPPGTTNLVGEVQLLRQKAMRAIENVSTIGGLPGANLIRTTDHVSLEEIRLRLEDLIRFRLEPLVDVIRASGLAGDSAVTARFAENQLAYDQRQLQAAVDKAEATRQAIAIYEAPATPETGTVTASGPRGRSSTTVPSQPAGNEALMPQLSDTFLDRLVALSGRSGDMQYRQKLVDDYRRAVETVIPLQQNVSYDTQLLKQVSSGAPAAARLDPASVRTQVETGRQELRQLIGKLNDLFLVLSRNMTPASQLFTITNPPTTKSVRSVSLERVALYGILVLLASVPVIFVCCFLHSRLQEEERVESRHAEHRVLHEPRT
jgi:hypothetical protein